jgi:hypothetical protein
MIHPRSMPFTYVSAHLKVTIYRGKGDFGCLFVLNFAVISLFKLNILL